MDFNQLSAEELYELQQLTSGDLYYPTDDNSPISSNDLLEAQSAIQYEADPSNFEVDVTFESVSEIVEGAKEQRNSSIVADRFNNGIDALLNIYDADKRQNALLLLAKSANKELDEVVDKFYTRLREVVVTKVREIQNTKDPFKAALLRNGLDTYLKNFVVDKVDRKELINKLSVEEGKVELYTLDDLLQMSDERGERWLVTGLFEFGDVVLLAAQSKTGKSMLANHLAMSVLTETKFLNKKTNKCNVLYIQNEENLAQTGKRLWGNGLQELELKDSKLYNELIKSKQLIIAKNLDIHSDIDTICDLIDTHSVKLLIIDALSSSLRKSAISEMDANQIHPVLMRLQNETQNRNLFTLLLHHTNKRATNDTKTNTINGVSGSSTIARANGGIMVMTAAGEVNEYNNPIVKFDFVPRNANPISLEAGIEEDEALYWCWVVYKESMLGQDTITELIKILDCLHVPFEKWSVDAQDDSFNKPVYGYNSRKIASKTQLPLAEVKKHINFLLRTDAIKHRTEKGKHIYCLPRTGSTWMDEYIHEQKQQQAEKSKQQNLCSVFIDAIKATDTLDKYYSLCKEYFALPEINTNELTSVGGKVAKYLGKEAQDLFISKFHELKHPAKFPVDSVVKVGALPELYKVTKYNPKSTTYNLKPVEGGELLTDISEEELTKHD